MRKPTRAGAVAAASAALLATAVVSSATAATAASTTAVRNNVAPYAKQSHFVSHASSSAHMAISVNLRPANLAGLRSTIAGQYRAGSATYHRWLSPAQFHAAYAPSKSTTDAVSSWLKSTGLNVRGVSANRMRVDATGSVATVEKAFGVSENIYRYKGHKLRANANAPHVPSAWAGQVSFISGLDDTAKLLQPRGAKADAHPGYGYSTPAPCTHDFSNPVTGHATPTFSDRGTTWPNPLTWTPCGYTPRQIRSSYGLGAPSPSDAGGAGATIGIVDAFTSPTLKSDANQFFANHNLPPFDSSNFEIVSTPGNVNHGESHHDPQGWYGEESLDVEWAHSMAPGAKVIYVGANTNDMPLDHALQDLIDSNQADVISNSWGWNGEPRMYGFIAPDSYAFMQAAAQGESILFSSGDDGDVANPTDVDTGIASASWPASSPWVTAVGGTSLFANSDGADQQYGWATFYSELDGANGQPANNGSETETNPTGDSWSPLVYWYGGGGGTSLHFTMDSFPGGNYQAGVVPNQLATTTRDDQGNVIQLSGGAHRVVPDISMVGDPNTGALYGETYLVSGDPLYDAGCTASPLGSAYEYCERRIGGTSLSSPLFAGVVAQAVAADGRQGLLNPALYANYAGLRSGGAVTDIVPPAGPLGVLRNVQTSFSANEATTLTTTFRPMNEGPVLPSSDTITIGAGGNSLFTARHYDNLTGLGAVGDVGAFVAALSAP
jgi:subtilase family serine protease